MKALPPPAAWSLIALVSAWLCGCSAPQKAERDADAPLTAAMACSTRIERCNARDDDCDGIIDEQADSSCGLAHAVGSCVRGTCLLDRCTEGYFNCNQIMSDGCEIRGECGQLSDAAQPAESQTPNTSGTPDAGSAQSDAALPAMSGDMTTDAHPGIKTSQAPQAGAGGQAGTPVSDDADGGEPDAAGNAAPAQEADAGVSCEPEACDGQDNDCDDVVDEGISCGCKDAAPSGQGPLCDQCLCESCGEALDGCTGTDDDEWNTLCADVLVCFGKSVKEGLCVGDDSDCFQNGDGPCAEEFRSAFSRGWVCTADPVRTPCGALTRVRLDCYRSKCADVCKA